MAELIWTREAERWLQDIFEHIALDDKEAASRTLEGILGKAELLTQHPELGYRYASKSTQLRILLHHHYRIAYYINADEVIVIIGVFHGALSLERYLSLNPP